VRRLLQLVLAAAIFACGIGLGAVWRARRVRTSPPPSPSPAAQRSDETPWPLNKTIVARSLQTQGFRTDKLRTNSDHDVVWRWLKESIGNYPQNWVKLNISDQDIYDVVLYPPKVLESGELAHCNHELAARGLPPLAAGKRYIPVQVNIDNIICPDWYGFIDADEAQLIYFEGRSA